MSLLRIEGLTVHYRVRRGLTRKSVSVVHAADAVTLELGAGETLALVGESGCGKSTVAMAILGLTKPTAGTVVFEGQDLSEMHGRERGALSGHMQVVFQDPYSSLDPRMTVHDIVAEPLTHHLRLSGGELRDRVISLLDTVGLGTQHLWRRPHEFSGGQCQRIAIARALALHPKLLVLDEPTSALDVSVQARILELLADLQQQTDMAYLFIAHDLAVVQAIATRVAVMYLGRIVEMGSAEAIFSDPLHPYTAALIASVPSPDPDVRVSAAPLSGDVPSAIDPPSGCRFHPRCPFRLECCDQVEPELRSLRAGQVACHLEAGTPA